jgi:hypothetical protein
LACRAVDGITSKGTYRARFFEPEPYRATISSEVVVLPRAYVSRPRAPKTMRRNKYYSVYGFLKPRHTRHTSGTYPVRIFRYKKTNSGKWKCYGYVRAKASDYESYTKYSRTLKLTSKGQWKLRACAPADAAHSKTWSSTYDYVTVN